MTLYEELEFRGLIKDCSDINLAKELLNTSKISFYCGFDPTGQSLTIGHLVQIIRIKLIQSFGHHPVIVIGGATGLIGDPKESGERKMLTIEQSLTNAALIEKQMSTFFEKENISYVNNYDWVKKYDMISFLRDIGKNFNVPYMLAKDVVKARLDSGISYTEFSYMLIQALDWWTLYKERNVQIQFGGSDQWGNITAGLDLIRKQERDCKVVGLSSPLLTKSDGTKFGKSESGTLWLDPVQTTPFQLYQYFLNSTDDDVIRFIKTLTLIPIPEIIELEKKVVSQPEKREAQKRLAEEVVKFTHGNDAYKLCLKLTASLFNNNFSDLTNKELEVLSIELGVGTISKPTNLVDLLVETKIFSSKREAREMIKNKALSINEKIIDDENLILDNSLALSKKYFIIRKGKKKHYIILWRK